MNLRDELINDPLGLGYAPHIASGADSVLADMLNTIRPEVRMPQMVDRIRIKTVLLGTGEYLRLSKSTHPYAQSTMLYMTDGDFRYVDLEAPMIVAMLSELPGIIEDGSPLLSEASVSTIMAMGKRPGTRAEQLGLGYVDHTAVATALRG